MLKLNLVPEARHWWRLWSQRFNALGLLILSWVQFDPVGVLHVWNMMPSEVSDALPPSFLKYVGLTLIALAMLSRLVTQKKIRQKVECDK